MLPKSQNYNSILRAPEHYAETELAINGRVYTHENLKSLTSSLNLYGDEYSVGATVMNQFGAVFFGVTAKDIPKFSRVEVWTRLVSGGEYTNWLPKGVFYTKRPDYDTESDVLSITGYDEMFRTEQVPFEAGSVISLWDNPTLRDVALHVVQGAGSSIISNWPGIGLEIEDITQIVDNISMTSIPYGHTVREILSDIAVVCGGNWTICFDNIGSETERVQRARLRLIRINALPETYYLIDSYGDAITFGGTRILV